MNGSTGKVVHEISSTGAVYFGDNTEPGDINETAQFDIAAGLVWQWSGDPGVHAAELHVHQGRGALPGQPGTRWPGGPVARGRGHRGGPLSRATRQSMSPARRRRRWAYCTTWPWRWGTMSTAAWAAQHQQPMLAAFGQWWISSQGCTRIRCAKHLKGGCTAPGEQLQQRWWTTVAPMEQGVAPPPTPRRAGHHEGPTFTGTCGLYVDGVGGPSGTGGQTCYLVNTGAMARAEANYGRSSTRPSPTWTRWPASSPWRCRARCPNWPPAPSTTRSRRSPARANVMQAWSSYGLRLDRRSTTCSGSARTCRSTRSPWCPRCPRPGRR